jgi:hypothetical protein
VQQVAALIHGRIGEFGFDLVTGWKRAAEAEGPRFQAFDLVV